MHTHFRVQPVVWVSDRESAGRDVQMGVQRLLVGVFPTHGLARDRRIRQPKHACHPRIHT